MNRIIKKSYVLILQIMICLSFFDSVIADELTIKSITVYPEKPNPKSEIVFTAEITGGDIEEIYMIVDEANDEFVYIPRHNISMSNIQGEIYTCNLTLLHEGATFIVYWPVIKSNDIWYNFVKERKTHDLYPEVSIVTPKKGYFYLLGKQIVKTFFGNTVLIGRTTIKIDIGTYNFQNIEKVEYCIDEKPKGTVKEMPFEWLWRTFSFGMYNIEIKAYVSELNYSNNNIQVLAFIL